MMIGNQSKLEVQVNSINVTPPPLFFPCTQKPRSKNKSGGRKNSGKKRTHDLLLSPSSSFFVSLGTLVREGKKYVPFFSLFFLSSYFLLFCRSEASHTHGQYRKKDCRTRPFFFFSPPLPFPFLLYPPKV